jgi:hypothetical protein
LQNSIYFFSKKYQPARPRSGHAGPVSELASTWLLPPPSSASSSRLDPTVDEDAFLTTVLPPSLRRSRSSRSRTRAAYVALQQETWTQSSSWSKTLSNGASEGSELLEEQGVEEAAGPGEREEVGGEQVDDVALEGVPADEKSVCALLWA